MKIFNGNAEAKKLDNKILEITNNSKDFGKLLIVMIGKNSSSEKYVNIKKRVGEKLGVKIEILEIDENLSNKDITDKVFKEFNSADVSSVIVQLPLPRPELNEVLDLIPLEKDVDVLSTKAQQKFYDSSLQRTSPVVRSAEYFIYSLGKANKIKTAIIIGGGFLVGKPIAKMLEKRGVTTQIIENYSKGMKLNADLIVLSAGIPNLVDASDIKEGANVIDFGSSVLDGKVVGDLDMKSVLDHLGNISPSPGGMGPLVVRHLFLNHLNQ